MEHIDDDDGTFNIMNKRYTRPTNKDDVYVWPRMQDGDIKAINDLYRKDEDFEGLYVFLSYMLYRREGSEDLTDYASAPRSESTTTFLIS